MSCQCTFIAEISTSFAVSFSQPPMGFSILVALMNLVQLGTATFIKVRLDLRLKAMLLQGNCVLKSFLKKDPISWTSPNALPGQDKTMKKFISSLATPPPIILPDPQILATAECLGSRRIRKPAREGSPSLGSWRPLQGPHNDFVAVRTS